MLIINNLVTDRTFKSITFDNGKEFTGWKEIANKHDISTYFAEVGAPNQRGLNENNNGLIRRDGLNKSMDFRNLPNALVQQVSSRRNLPVYYRGSINNEADNAHDCGAML